MVTLKRTLMLAAITLFSLFIAGTILAQDGEITPEAPAAEASPEATMTPLPTEIPTEIPTEAPTATPLPTEIPVTEVAVVPLQAAAVSVSSFTPTQLVQGTGGTLTISGANFTSSTTVSLNGNTPLAITSQTADTLVAAVGMDVPTGTYTVQLSDASGTTSAGNMLTIVAPTATPKLSVSQTEPIAITYGTTGNLSVLGANFTSNTTVRLSGYGFLTVTYINATALKAALPTGIPAGVYVVEISDPSTGTAVAPATFTVNAVVATATAAPTATQIPGQPELIISTYSASPATIYAGDTTTLTFTVVNAGSRTAQGVVVSLGNGDFTPSNGQSSLTLPDLAAGASYTVSLAVAASDKAATGAQSIAITMTSRDSTGQTYTDNGVVSVTIGEETAGESQVVLDSYLVTPGSAKAGENVTVQALFKNTGTETASQVLVQLDGNNSVLIAGSQGNAFSLGDMPAGATVPVVMPLVVAGSATSGVQAQSLNISYLQDGAAKQATASISLDVLEDTEASPLILLQKYSSGQDDALTPGQQFTYTMTLQNAGTVDISNLLVTFGTVSSDSDSSTGSGVTSGSTGAISSTSTTSSSSFAIYGSGGTLLLGNLAAGSTADVTQAFLVSSDLDSGIHSLPITLQYTTPLGTTEQQSLDAGLIVVVPPRLRVTAEDVLDDPLTAGEETTLNINIANTGSSAVSLTELRATGENVEIGDGAQINLDPMDASDDTSESITFTPTEAGDYTVTVEVDYIDDLNQTQTISTMFTGTVEAAAEQQTRPTGTNRPTMPQQTQSNDLFGRLLLGFLGFGG